MATKKTKPKGTSKKTDRAPQGHMQKPDADGNQVFLLIYQGDPGRVHALVRARNVAEACSHELVANDEFESSPDKWTEVNSDDENVIYHAYQPLSGWEPTHQEIVRMNINDIHERSVYIASCALTSEAARARDEYRRAQANIPIDELEAPTRGPDTPHPDEGPAVPDLEDPLSPSPEKDLEDWEKETDSVAPAPLQIPLEELRSIEEEQENLDEMLDELSRSEDESPEPEITGQPAEPIEGEPSVTIEDVPPSENDHDDAQDS